MLKKKSNYLFFVCKIVFHFQKYIQLQARVIITSYNSQNIYTDQLIKHGDFIKDVSFRVDNLDAVLQVDLCGFIFEDHSKFQ